MTPYEQGFEDCKKQVAKAMVPAIEQAILMEREACARLCDDVAQRMEDHGEGPTGYIGYVTECAAAIRARWQK